MHTRRPLLAVGLLLCAAVALVGCTSDDDDAASSEGAAAPAAAGRDYGAGAPQASPQAPAPAASPATVGTPNRAIVYTGDVRVATADVPGAATRAIRTTLAAGGYVAADAREVATKRPTITLTLRVPSARFTTTVDALAGLGTERSRRLTTDDRQTSAIDLDTRIAGQRASVARTRALLDRATSLSDLTTIERELTERETVLAGYEASRRTLADQVSLSTITLHLELPAVAAKPKPRPKPEDKGFLAGLSGGWSALRTTGTAVSGVVGWLLPFLVVLAVVGTPTWWAYRRRRASLSRPSAPVPPRG